MGDASAFDLPTIIDQNRPFWDGVAQGDLVLRQCRGCGDVHYHPRPNCPVCGSDAFAWVNVSGRATLELHTVVDPDVFERFGLEGGIDGTPAPTAVVGLVVLEEGPRLIAEICGAEASQLKAGAALELASPVSTASGMVLAFRPARTGEAVRAVQAGSTSMMRVG